MWAFSQRILMDTEWLVVKNCCWKIWPSQSRPPMHILLRSLTPMPQDTEHDDHGCHWPHSEHGFNSQSLVSWSGPKLL